MSEGEREKGGDAVGVVFCDVSGVFVPGYTVVFCFCRLGFYTFWQALVLVTLVSREQSYVKALSRLRCSSSFAP